LISLYVSELNEQDAHSNLANIGQAFSFVNFDFRVAFFFVSVGA
jgi:hypothetical protein